ncbi:MAG TPA: pentapeptide repeat-containing protein [bacterium]|nr:pentapeptide repeat-containing protein [bacterium]
MRQRFHQITALAVTTVLVALAVPAPAGAQRVVNGCKIQPQTICTNARLSNANLSGVVLSGANLTGANLSYANLRGAKLSRAKLTGANLSYANLSYADLAEANLQRAVLARVNLTGANLSYANLLAAFLQGDPSHPIVIGSVWNGANLTGATWINGHKCAKGSIGGCK